MYKFSYNGEKLQHLSTCSWQSTCFVVSCFYRNFVHLINPFGFQVFYFVFLSFLGFWVLKDLKPRTEFRPRNIDLFFTSVSAITVSSMSTVEMEAFSNAQLIVMTILMFVGGEIFTSMVGLHLKRSKIITWNSEGKGTTVDLTNSVDQIQLSIEPVPDNRAHPLEPQNYVSSPYYNMLNYNSIKFLGFVVLGYLLVIQILGVASVLMYLALFSSAKDILRNKGIKALTFAVFTVVSTFASCGFVPTNENMIVFSKNSGLLWILIPQVLLGNTLFPSCLRFFLWVLGKKIKKSEAKYLLKNTTKVGYLHLLPSLHSSLLVATVLGFILTGFLLFCSLEWNSEGLGGLNTYQKVIGILFETVNARHSGETIVDLSTIAPAILVFFVVMMYLPPYTSFLPVKGDEHSSLEREGTERRRKWIAESLIFSQLSYLVIFIILICITERKSIKEDPINFSVLNIVIEVISANGNVGFTTGYSCERQLRPQANCTNKWYGFSGKWSDEGKIILILVMFSGRLKKFNMNGGKAWKLL
ncbi:sodium transporter HKT1-like [Olea europaea var. sylvestris]|uniref:sodium transporter HKT1-like n=1 Tax=Olea europaea var. sylvestris TaxID=158386 RepID=UPI000C1D0248|nr:sodium transporter HKT1-like [Olea europaea var. sylvestris]